MSHADPLPSVSTAETAEQFALRSADALAATLNLRRTLARLVHLAVPRFGTWAGVSLLDPTTLRQVTYAHGQPVTETVHRVAVTGADVIDVLHEAARGRILDRPADTAVLAACGIPAEAAQRLAADGATVTAVPLRSEVAVEAVLVVAGTQPRDQAELSALARRAATAVTAAHVFEERAALAATLRAALLPAALPTIPGLDLAAVYRPALETTQIGGDFYDVLARSDGAWAMSMGDVCGKGVDAAVMTGQVRQSLRTAGLVTDDPVRTLKLVNDTMLATDGENFVTLVYGIVRPEPGRVCIDLACGGHPPALVLRGDRVERVPARGTIVGMLPQVSFTPSRVELGPGDLLFLYTDGVTEARRAGDMLGLEAVERLLGDCADLTAQAVADRAVQLVLEHLDGQRHDDIAVLVVRCDP